MHGVSKSTLGVRDCYLEALNYQHKPLSKFMGPLEWLSFTQITSEC